ncbi:NUDIX domain-containing protein [Microtetraspora malaysiensis]|uniref:NUDIX domain-containing protein n=1 Tax=Microtetraspora malaysiensis TaxID=161358 RepID=A0ABW6SXV9_9ACTN
MDPEAPLYERDPVAWNAYLAEGNAKQARKRVGADVLIRDEQGRILLVDPKYKPDWDLPGGMAEANEAPAAAARREIKEELGLDIEIGRLLVVDWVSPHGPWDDSLMFVFDGGTLSGEGIAKISLAEDELAGFGFHNGHQAAHLLRPYVWRRTRAAVKALGANGPVYLEDAT